jgi:hypothetical protein
MTYPNDSLTQKTAPKHETPGYKKLKFAVVFMGVLIVLGLGVIVTTIIYRAMGLVGTPENELPKTEVVKTSIGKFEKLTIYTTPDLILKSVNGNGPILYLHFSTPEGNLVKILDTQTGEIQGEVLIKPTK